MVSESAAITKKLAGKAVNAVFEAFLHLLWRRVEKGDSISLPGFGSFKVVESAVRKILDAGAQGFIQKSFSLATLSEKLKEVLEGK